MVQSQLDAYSFSAWKQCITLTISQEVPFHVQVFLHQGHFWLYSCHNEDDLMPLGLTKSAIVIKSTVLESRWHEWMFSILNSWYTCFATIHRFQILNALLQLWIHSANFGKMVSNYEPNAILTKQITSTQILLAWGGVCVCVHHVVLAGQIWTAKVEYLLEQW